MVSFISHEHLDIWMQQAIRECHSAAAAVSFTSSPELINVLSDAD